VRCLVRGRATAVAANSNTTNDKFQNEVSKHNEQFAKPSFGLRLHKCKRLSKNQGTSQLGQSAVRQSLQMTMRVESTGLGFTGEICKHVATPSLERLAEPNSSGHYLESLILSYQCLVVRLELLKNFFHLNERQHMQLNQVKCTNAATQ
jgi:hypothetical protein